MTRLVTASVQTSVDRAEDWRDKAACFRDPVFLDHGRDPSMAALIASLEAQKQVCRRCPVSAECLNFALKVETGVGSTRPEEEQVFGGLNRRERDAVKRAARRTGQTPAAMVNPGRINDAIPHHSGDVSITSKVVAYMCGITPEKVWKLADKGTLPCLPKTGGYRRYSLAAVNRLIREGVLPARETVDA